MRRLLEHVEKYPALERPVEFVMDGSAETVEASATDASLLIGRGFARRVGERSARLGGRRSPRAGLRPGLPGYPASFSRAVHHFFRSRSGFKPIHFGERIFALTDVHLRRVNAYRS